MALYRSAGSHHVVIRILHILVAHHSAINQSLKNIVVGRYVCLSDVPI